MIITKKGRERLVLVSVEKYHRLKRRARRTFAVADLSAERIRALEKAQAACSGNNTDPDSNIGVTCREWSRLGQQRPKA